MREKPMQRGRRNVLKGAGAGALALAGLPVSGLLGAEQAHAQTRGEQKLYVQEGTDPAFKQLLAKKAFPIGKDSHNGVKGSTIRVNQKAFRKADNGDKPVAEDIFIHTLCNSLTKREDFPKWTRWYQEDGGTQVFRLFKGEHNVRNERKGAARIEAFTELSWEKGDWHSWQGTYTIVKPYRSMIFQAKNHFNHWGVSIDTTDEGDVRLNRREGEDIMLGRKMVGKPFVLGVRDNGHDYEVYYNKKKVGDGSFNRPKGKTNFRWGMYEPRSEPVRHDAMIFVTGVQFE